MPLSDTWAGEAFPTPMDGRRFSLVPFLPEHYRPTYALSIQPEISFRWRYHGVIPQYEVFERTLFANVFQQFAVVTDKDPRNFIGLVVAYNASQQDRFVYLAAMMDRGFGAGALEAVALMIRYIFTVWPFRKLYLEVPSYNVPQFRSVIKTGLLKEEGRLMQHHFYDNSYWDQYLFAIYHDDAIDFAQRHPGLFLTGVEPEGLTDIPH